MRPTWIALAILLPSLGWAQTVTVPTFPVSEQSTFIDVAASDSGVYFLRRSSVGPQVYVQRMFGSVIDPPITANYAGPISGPQIASDPNGGFTAVWLFLGEVWARFLDVDGRPTGTPLQFSSTDGFTSGTPRVAGFAGGAAIGWIESIPNAGVHLFGQIGSRFYDISNDPHDVELATTPDGGCIVAWREGVDSMQMRRFAPDGEAATGAIELVESDMRLSGVAVDPSGTLAIVGIRPDEPAPSHQIVVFRFASNGAALGPEILVGTTSASSDTYLAPIMPDAAFDFAGNLHVVWGNKSPASPGVHVRAFTPDGTPFGPSLQVSDRVPQGQVQTTRLPSGEFTNAWVSSATAYANTVSLCAPGSAVCGDGVLAPACERCDDGAANDDAIPDACRTTCLLPRCGDGVTDTGEECDDGNYTRCDGCGPRCTIEAGIVCGDGVTACGEQCDDGNGALLDGCTPACELEFAPGGGKRSVDCLSAWVIDNPTTVPPYDKNGDINPTQHCVDNDSRCDFDGGVPGSCGFRVQACGKTTSVPGCSTGSRLSSWEVHRPSEKQGAKRPWLAAVRASLLGVPGAIVGPVDGNTCSAPVVVTVPLRGEPGRYVPAKLVLQTRATSYEDVLDKDKLTLVCEPAS